MNKYIVSQFEKPHGILGILAGAVMSLNNKERINWVVEQLYVQPGDKLLEIGFGPGEALRLIAGKLKTGSIVGIEHSEVMLRHAINKSTGYIKENKIRLLFSSVEDIKFAPASFDKIFASNVHFFWGKPVIEFERLKKFLVNEGKLFMIFQPRWARTEEDIKAIAQKTANQFKAAGLKNINIKFKPMKPVTCISVSAQKL